MWQPEARLASWLWTQPAARGECNHLREGEPQIAPSSKPRGRERQRLIPCSWAGKGGVPATTPVWLRSFFVASECEETLAAIPTAESVERTGDREEVVAVSWRLVPDST